MKLNGTAKSVLREAGVTQAEWMRAQGYRDGRWGGDACGCPDDRCKDGFHHEPDEECGCLRALLADYTRERCRRADERRLTDLLSSAQRALASASDACLLWADDVSQQAERRLGVPAGDEQVFGDEGYGQALDFCSEVRKLSEQAGALAGRFQQRNGDHASAGSAT